MSLNESTAKRSLKRAPRAYFARCTPHANVTRVSGSNSRQPDSDSSCTLHLYASSRKHAATLPYPAAAAAVYTGYLLRRGHCMMARHSTIEFVGWIVRGYMSNAQQTTNYYRTLIISQRSQAVKSDRIRKSPNAKVDIINRIYLYTLP